MNMSPLAERVCRYAEQLNMLPADTDFLCGVSGGSDSVALLYLMKEIFDRQPEKCRTLRVVHVEHGIRGAESLEDAAFTEMLCRNLGIPFECISVSSPEYARKKGIGMEEAARFLRYEALKRSAAEQKSRIVLAHHMDDNAETVLFQLARGSGIRGLCGILPVRDDEEGNVYIRPLLCIRKKELETYLERLGQSWRVDATNSDIEYSRNRIRSRVLPELERVNSQAAVHINASAAQLAEIEDYLHRQMISLYSKLVREEKNHWELELKEFTECHRALQKELLLELLGNACGKKKDLGTVHVDQLLDLCMGQSGKTGSFPYGVHAVREFDRLLLYREESPKSGLPLEKLEISADMLGEEEKVLELALPGGKIFLRTFAFDGDLQKIPKNKYTKWLDYDKIKNGFCIRTRECGDYLISDILGHRKKLKRYLIDEKIPVSERDNIYLAASGKQILWIIGGRISEDVKITPDTVRVTEMLFYKASGEQ